MSRSRRRGGVPLSVGAARRRNKTQIDRGIMLALMFTKIDIRALSRTYGTTTNHVKCIEHITRRRG